MYIFIVAKMLQKCKRFAIIERAKDTCNKKENL